jgi:hypothetical protein
MGEESRVDRLGESGERGDEDGEERQRDAVESAHEHLQERRTV